MVAASLVAAERTADTPAFLRIDAGKLGRGKTNPLVTGNAYGKLPLSFEPNQGQVDARVKFVARVSGYTLFVTEDEAVFAGRDGSVERMKLIGVNRSMRMEPLDKQPGISNYFIGNDPSQWRTNVPNYGRVALRDVYHGIDLVFYGNDRQLEYDWVVSPRADPKQIREKWEGPNQVTKNASGDLVLSTSLIQQKPTILQDGKRIQGGYRVRGREVAFELARYDAAKPIVIDPVLVYSTYLGGNNSDFGYGIAVDSSGNAYVTGSTPSTNFPTTNPLQASNLGFGDLDAFVTKINASGSARVYSTYLGGGGPDNGRGIAVDSSGNAYVVGYTGASNFPLKVPIQSSYGGSGADAFVTKINAAGSALVYSTYLGGSGSDFGYGIAVDGAGNAYVIGGTQSSDFPTSNSLQANYDGVGDAFVTKINAAGSAYVYSTYLGGSGYDIGYGIAADATGNAYVTGVTQSIDFPTMNPLQASYRGNVDENENGDAFVTKINPSGSAYVYSTYLGGSGGDAGYGIALDSSGNAYVTGRADSSDFPTTNPLQTYAGIGNTFVTKINTAGSEYIYSTYLGGSAASLGFGIAVDGSGNAYVTGDAGANLTTVNPLQATFGGFSGDAFAMKINAAGSAYVYSTYLGGSGTDYGTGIAVDGAGNAYVTGLTDSPDFPTANALQVSGGGGADAFVLSIFSLPQPFAAGGEALAAGGGSGSLSLTFPPGWAWTASSDASWLTLNGPTSGTGSGTLSFQVGLNGGTGRSATITVAGFSFTIEQQAASIPGLSLIGSVAHIAAEENWTTAFTLVNKANAPVQIRLSLFGDALDPSGSGPLTLPLDFPQPAALSSSLLATSLDRTIAANASLIVNTAGPQNPPVEIGSAQIAATGAVDGFAIFHQVVTTQEAVVPMETRNASAYLLPFDNTNGLVMGVAVENVAVQDAVIGVIIRDDNGVVISGPGATISLPGKSHTSFVLSDPTLGFPITAGKRGTIEFDTPSGGRIAVLGIRFSPPNNALTTIPALANVGIGGGSIAHLASGGDGWQTTFVLVNTGTSATQVTLSFFNDQTGLPLPLPLSFPQLGTANFYPVPSITRPLAAGATLVIVSGGVQQLLTGSAQLSTTGNVSGFVIFRHNDQEAVVPLESRNANAYILAFDNTGGTFTGIAVNSVSAQAASVPVIVRDDTGAQIATDALNLAPNGHTQFTLVTDKYPGTANIRGTIEFDTPANAQIGALGIRIPAGVAHTYTTLPALAK
jgi:Beta-propeller repeat/Putative binding domain, N-terminal